MSCENNPEYDQHVRVINNYDREISNIYIGNVTFNNLLPTETSWFNLVPCGVSRMTGDFFIQDELYTNYNFGEVSFNGEESKYWDITIDQFRTIHISETDAPSK